MKIKIGTNQSTDQAFTLTTAVMIPNVGAICVHSSRKEKMGAGKFPVIVINPTNSSRIFLTKECFLY